MPEAENPSPQGESPSPEKQPSAPLHVRIGKTEQVYSSGGSREAYLVYPPPLVAVFSKTQKQSVTARVTHISLDGKECRVAYEPPNDGRKWIGLSETTPPLIVDNPPMSAAKQVAIGVGVATVGITLLLAASLMLDKKERKDGRNTRPVPQQKAREIPLDLPAGDLLPFPRGEVQRFSVGDLEVEVTFEEAVRSGNQLSYSFLVRLQRPLRSNLEQEKIATFLHKMLAEKFTKELSKFANEHRMGERRGAQYGFLAPDPERNIRILLTFEREK